MMVQNRRVVQKVLQHFLYLSQNQQEMPATYVVNLECPACYCSAAETIRFLAHAHRVVKVAWCCDVRLKQWAVIEFLVEEKESVTNIYRRLKNVYGDNAVDKSTVNRWTSRIASSEKGQAQLSDAPRSGRPTTAASLALLQRADELIRKDRRITARKLATELSVSKGSVNNIIDALGYAKFAHFGFHEA
jgi:DNA-binding MarR family transcriptional regulator